MTEITKITASPAETIDFGRKIGRGLTGGEVVCLIGPLGSGKTHLIKGIAAGAGAQDTQQVNSPTFVLINEYESTKGLTIYHIDAYRLESIAEFEMLGFDDLCTPVSVVLIEWADKILPAIKNIDLIEIKLSHQSESERKILINNLPSQISSQFNQ